MYSYEKSVSIGILVFSLSNFAFSQWPGAGGKMPAIGVVNGSVMDSTSGLPIEYASISLVNMRSDEVVTGALSDKQADSISVKYLWEDIGWWWNSSAMQQKRYHPLIFSPVKGAALSRIWGIFSFRFHLSTLLEWKF